MYVRKLYFSRNHVKYVMAIVSVSQYRKEGIFMPLVKVIRHGQVTLPAQYREALELKEGDYLEVELKGDQIVLKPAVVLDREQAISQLHRLMDKVQAKTKHVPIKEIEADVAAAIKAVRRQKRHAQSRA